MLNNILISGFPKNYCIKLLIILLKLPNLFSIDLNQSNGFFYFKIPVAVCSMLLHIQSQFFFFLTDSQSYSRFNCLEKNKARCKRPKSYRPNADCLRNQKVRTPSVEKTIGVWAIALWTLAT